MIGDKKGPFPDVFPDLPLWAFILVPILTIIIGDTAMLRLANLILAARLTISTVYFYNAKYNAKYAHSNANKFIYKKIKENAAITDIEDELLADWEIPKSTIDEVFNNFKEYILNHKYQLQILLVVDLIGIIFSIFLMIVNNDFYIFILLLVFFIILLSNLASLPTCDKCLKVLSDKNNKNE